MFDEAYEVVVKTEQVEICLYKQGDGKSGSVIIVPPESGHGSIGLIDYGKDQSLVRCAMDNVAEGKSVLVINFLDVTHERRNETYDDRVLSVRLACNTARIIGGEGIHLVGLCQGSPLAACVTSLFGEEQGIEALTVVAAPMDVTAAPSVLDEAVAKPLSEYEDMVNFGVVPFHQGRMAGADMLMAWKSLNAVDHYCSRYMKWFWGDFSGERLYKWYDVTQSLAGPMYLKMIEDIFQKGLLIKNEMVVLGQKVDLRKIVCRVNVVYGNRDVISPAPHTLALLDVVSSEEKYVYEVDGAHISVFQGRSGIKNQWPTIFAKG